MKNCSNRIALVVSFLVLTFGLVALVRPAFTQGKNDVVSSTFVPASHVFSCGSGFSFVSVGISDHGNVSTFESPSGVQHMVNNRTGYGICYRGFSAPLAYDHGGGEAGWAAGVTTSQPNGPNTFPLEISRNTADGLLRVTRRITGNSFVGPVTKGNATYDSINANAQGCDVLGECGNCTNRTIHVLTRVTSLSSFTEFVKLIEFADIDINGDAADDEWARTGDSVMAWEDPNSPDDTAGASERGMLVQTLVTPASTGVFASIFGVPGDCEGALGGQSTPISNFDGEAYLLMDYGALGVGSNTGGAFRVHYRRF